MNGTQVTRRFFSFVLYNPIMYRAAFVLNIASWSREIASRCTRIFWRAHWEGLLGWCSLPVAGHQLLHAVAGEVALRDQHVGLLVRWVVANQHVRHWVCGDGRRRSHSHGRRLLQHKLIHHFSFYKLNLGLKFQIVKWEKKSTGQRENLHFTELQKFWL